MLRQYAGSKRNAIASRFFYKAAAVLGVPTAAIGMAINVQQQRQQQHQPKQYQQQQQEEQQQLRCKW